MNIYCFIFCFYPLNYFTRVRIFVYKTIDEVSGMFCSVKFGFPCGSAGKESACNAEDPWVQSLGWEDPLEKGKALPTLVFWPGDFHGLYSPWIAKNRS